MMHHHLHRILIYFVFELQRLGSLTILIKRFMNYVIFRKRIENFLVAFDVGFQPCNLSEQAMLSLAFQALITYLVIMSK